MVARTKLLSPLKVQPWWTVGGGNPILILSVLDYDQNEIFSRSVVLSLLFVCSVSSKDANSTCVCVCGGGVIQGFRNCSQQIFSRYVIFGIRPDVSDPLVRVLVCRFEICIFASFLQTKNFIFSVEKS